MRKAKFGDIPRLTELLEQGYQRSKYRDRGSVSIKETKSLLVSAIQRHGLTSAGGSCVFVTENQGVVDGFIAGLLDRVYHIGDKLTATDIFFYVTPEGSPRSAGHLIDAFIDWTQDIEEVVEIRMAATDVIQPAEQSMALYQRKGFTQSGVIYERRTDL